MHRAPAKGSKAFTFSAKELEIKRGKEGFGKNQLKKHQTLTMPMIKLWDSLQREAGKSSMSVSLIDQEMFSKQLYTYRLGFIPFTLLIMGMAKNLATQSGLIPC